MSPQSPDKYNLLFTSLIKKQILILGPDITLFTVKNVQGLEVDNWGTVTKVTGDPQTILQNLINQFIELSGLIVKKTLESILATEIIAPVVVPEIQQASAASEPQLAKTENSQDLQKMVEEVLASAQQVQQGK